MLNFARWKIFGASKISLTPALWILATMAVFTINAFCQSVSVPQIIPETVELRTGYVGVPYDLPLARLLPANAPRLRWELVCNAAEGSDTELQCPTGVRLVDILNNNGDVVGQALRVNPVARDLGEQGMPKPYTFEVLGRNGDGINVRIRFNLQVRPLGVDARKFDETSQAAKQDLDEDDIRNFVVDVAPARRRPAKKDPPPPVPFVLVKSTADEETVALTETLDPNLNPEATPCIICKDTTSRANFFIANSDVAPLLQYTIQTDPTAQFNTGDYLVVHVVKWKPLKDNKSDPERELWALFEKIEPRTIEGRTYSWLPRFASTEKGTITEKRIYDTRIFGSKRVYLLPVHINTPATWDIKYKLNIDQQVPTPIQNALQLAATVLGGGAAPEKVTPDTKDIWGARLMLIRYRASDMIVNVNAVTPDADLQIKEQNKDYSKKYDNEGRYWWDVSVGMPANSIKELEYKVDATGQNNVVSVKKVERQNAYGFLNLFFQPTDLEANSFLTTPHLVFGVPISGKPLDRPVIALGTGIHRDFFKINFFAGVAFNKVREPKTLQAGDAATEGQLEADIRTRRQAKFVFGINFPVRQFIEAIKKK